MGKMFFAVELHEYYDANTILSEIQLAEQLGYDAVWLGDSQMIWREMYVLLGAAAKATSRVLLGTGVTNPITRLPSVTASAVTTLQELSGGRMVLGVGVGFSSVRTVGMKPATHAELEEFVHRVRELCSGRPVPAPHGDMRLTFGAPQKCPPIVIGAGGPKAIRLAGRIADGVILSGVAGRAALTEALQRVQEGFTERTQTSDGFQVMLSKPMAIHPESRKARDAVRVHVARGFLRYHAELSEEAKIAQEKMRATYNVYEHMTPGARHSELVPQEIIPLFAIAGAPQECREQTLNLFEAGIDQLHIRPHGIEGAPRRTAMEAFAQLVMEPLRQSAQRDA